MFWIAHTHRQWGTLASTHWGLWFSRTRGLLTPRAWLDPRLLHKWTSRSPPKKQWWGGCSRESPESPGKASLVLENMLSHVLHSRKRLGQFLPLWKTPSHSELEHWRDGAAPAALSSCPEGKSLFGWVSAGRERAPRQRSSSGGSLRDGGAAENGLHPWSEAWKPWAHDCVLLGTAAK